MNCTQCPELTRLAGRVGDISVRMNTIDRTQQSLDGVQTPAIQCDACESALTSQGDHNITVLLLEQLTVPVVGCDDHLERFSAVCGYTTDETATLVDHRPAGGICCPSCQLSVYTAEQPVVPVQDGAVAILACPEHQAELVTRFQTGLDTQSQLTASLDVS